MFKHTHGLLIAAMAASCAMPALGQSTETRDPLAAHFVRGVNWQNLDSASLRVLDTLGIDVLHGSIGQPSINAPLLSSRPDVKMLYVGLTIGNPIAGQHFCERMTIDASAPEDGSDGTAFCFRSRTGRMTIHHDARNARARFVGLFAREPATFRSIQFGSGQFYETHADRSGTPLRNSTFHVTLDAQLTSPAEPTDTLFIVTVSRMRITGRSGCPADTVKTANRESHTFACVAAQLLPVNTEHVVVDTFPWTTVFQRSPYRTSDSTEIMVRWVGATATANLHFVRLETSDAHRYGALSDSLGVDTIAEYGALKNEIDRVHRLYAGGVARYYISDEQTASFFEPLGLYARCIARAQRELGIADSLAPAPSSEIDFSIARQFAGMVGAREAWIGVGVTDPECVSPYTDSGWGGWCGNCSDARKDELQRACHGLKKGYLSQYRWDADWHARTTLELGGIGTQAFIGAQVAAQLLPGALFRQRGGRWWSNPFFCGKFDRWSQAFVDSRVPTAEEIRLFMNLSVAFGATGILPYTLADDRPEIDGEHNRLQTGVCTFAGYRHDADSIVVSSTHGATRYTDTIYAGLKTNFSELQHRMQWLKSYGDLFVDSRLVGVMMHTGRRVRRCNSSKMLEYFDTVTFSSSSRAVPLVDAGRIETLGLPDDRSIVQTESDPPEFRFWCVAQFRTGGTEAGDSTEYLLVLNPRTDPRDAGGRFLDPCETCDKFSARGTRTIRIPITGERAVHVTQVALDPSLGDTAIDAIVPAGGSFEATYLPGAAKLFRISKPSSN